MSDRRFRHLCPNADELDAMTDDEFWQRVAENLAPSWSWDDPADTDPLDIAIAQDVCGECGSVGACGWDSEGRPLIHAVGEER